jgi:uncharacterized protein (DUF2384 family)
MADAHNKEKILKITQAVISYLDEWKLTPEQMLEVLGLPEKTRTRHLQQYRGGDKAFPQTEDVMMRIDHISGIADALRTTFPFNQQMRYLWLRKPHRRFRQKRPLDVIFNEGIHGLMRVRVEVDCTYGWVSPNPVSK